jgi:hypothetical protein
MKLQALMDEMIKSGKIREMIVVAPNGNNASNFFRKNWILLVSEVSGYRSGSVVLVFGFWSLVFVFLCDVQRSQKTLDLGRHSKTKTKDLRPKTS